MNAALILRGETDESAVKGSAVKGSITVKRKDLSGTLKWREATPKTFK